MEFVLGIAVSQVLIALYLLLSSKSRHKAKLFLYLYVIIAILHFSIKLVLYAVIKDEFLFENLITGFAYAYSLLIYLYIKKYLQKSKKKSSYLIHAIAFTIAITLYIVVFISAFIQYDKELIIMYRKLTSYVLFFPFTGYYIASLVLLNRAKKEQRNKYDSLKNIRFIVIMMLFSLLFSFAPLVFSFIDIVLIVRSIIYILIILSVVFIVQHYFHTIHLEKREEEESGKNKLKYEKYRLKPEAIDKYAVKLEKLMSKKKLYLNAELTLEILAEEMEIPKHHLTQLLNEHFEKNFYQYINSLRVNTVKQKLKVDHETSILDIAFACGFNTKSSFNNYFKTLTGFTPTEYRQNLSLSKDAEK